MKTSEFIARHFIVQGTSGLELCAFCGSLTSNGNRLKDMLSANFNDWQAIRFNSGYLCDYCTACLSGDAFNGKALRNFSFICTDAGIEVLPHADIASRLWCPITEDIPFVFVISFTKKKHIFYKAVINENREKFIVSTEYHNIEIGDDYRYLAPRCGLLYETGFSKEEIKTGKYRKYGIIQEFGHEHFAKVEHEISRYRCSALMKLTIFALQKETEKHD